MSGLLAGKQVLNGGMIFLHDLGPFGCEEQLPNNKAHLRSVADQVHPNNVDAVSQYNKITSYSTVLLLGECGFKNLALLANTIIRFQSN